jgi:hypothetical protein
MESVVLGLASPGPQHFRARAEAIEKIFVKLNGELCRRYWVHQLVLCSTG